MHQLIIHIECIDWVTHSMRYSYRSQWDDNARITNRELNIEFRKEATTFFKHLLTGLFLYYYEIQYYCIQKYKDNV